MLLHRLTQVYEFILVILPGIRFRWHLLILKANVLNLFLIIANY